MNPVVIPFVDTSHLDKILLDDKGRLRLLPAATYMEIDNTLLRVWCAKNARYQLVTVETVAWLKHMIDGRTAIEVGAGMGDLGYHLGIPMTDLGMQNIPEIAAYYRSLGQATTNPPADVEIIDAVEAVKKYQPAVIVASWLTQKWREGDTEGSIYGPDEHLLISNCQAYIHLGNENVHGAKRIRKAAHKTHRFPWLVSRAASPEKNVIYVWGG